MIQLNLHKLPDKLNFTVFLEQESKIMGVLMPINTDEISAQDFSLKSDTPITGTTTSKLEYITSSYPQGTDYENAPPIYIRGTDIQAKIDTYNDTITKYRMYIDSGFEITYTEKNGVTTFSVYPPATDLQSDATVFMLAYWGLIDEPKLDSNLFINRGVNNVFEAIKRLKTSTTIQELKKTGFGFFTFYDGGTIN